VTTSVRSQALSTHALDVRIDVFRDL